MPVISSINLHQCQSFDQFKRNWKYSGSKGDRANAPTTTASDPYFNSTAWDQNTFNWSNVDVSTDYTNEGEQYRWYCRKLFYIESGTFTFSGQVDDDVSIHIVPKGANGTQIFGNVADRDGGSAFSWSNETFTVSDSGIYYFTLRGIEGGGADMLKITAMNNITKYHEVTTRV